MIVQPFARIAAVLALAVGVQAGAQATPAMDGQRLFLRCKACHDVSPVPVAKVGPNLRGVVGRKAGSLAGFKYSPAMQAQTILWDEANLDRWLTRPTALVPGTSMAFAGLPKPEDRAAIIAFLKQAK